MLRQLQGPAPSIFSGYICPSCLVRQVRTRAKAAHTPSASPDNESNTGSPSPQIGLITGASKNRHRKRRPSNTSTSATSPPRIRRVSLLRLRRILTPSLRINAFQQHWSRRAEGRSGRLKNLISNHPTSHLPIRNTRPRPIASGVRKARFVRRGLLPRNAEPIDINKLYSSIERGGLGDGKAGDDSQRVHEVPKVGAREVERGLVAQLREAFADGKPRKKAGVEAAEKQPVKGIRRITAASGELKPITDIEQPPVPRLHHGLDRVLFNPGVYQLQDPRTRIFNFDPYLHRILPVDQFNFKALQEYETSSKDKQLGQIASDRKMRYYGSTSSMTGMLRHFHFLLSQMRPLNFSMLTQAFEVKNKQFSNLAKVPAAVFLRYQEGSQPARYAIDADKFFDGTNIMSLLGHSLEKLLTCPVSEFEEYKLQRNKEQLVPSAPPRNSYHYTSMYNMLMRSQLDAADPRLPGTGVFDVKTRAVVSVRAHAWDDHRPGLGYEIKQEYGQWESFEREQYDMLRTTMLSYSLQARMGRMDGIFAAYHNIERIFGFQYFGLEDLDLGLHGQRDRTLGDQEFKISLSLLQTIFDKATEKFPKQSIRLHIETRGGPSFLYAFAEPMSEEEVEAIQSRNDEKNAKITRALLYPDVEDDVEPEEEDADAWAELRAKVETDIRAEQTLGGAPLANVSDELEESNDDEQLSFEHQLLRLQVSAEKLKTTIQDAAHTIEIGQKLENTLRKRRGAKSTPNGIRTSVAELLQLRLKISAVASKIKEEQGEYSKLMFFVHHIEEVLDDQVLKVADMEIGLVPRPQRLAAKKAVQARQEAGNTAEEASDVAETETPSTGQAEDDATAPEEPALAETVPDPSSPVPAIDTDKPLLAMTLAIRNKVNGTPVTRPEHLTASDAWAVEYLLDEIKGGKQAWALYEACQARRRDQLEKDRAAAYGLRLFQKETREWVRRGKVWRAEKEEEEKEKGVEVFEAFDKGSEK